eukprot:CAMPEP_0184861660 /NCGR_PEP_ID=MMETSP0580-20130426/6291_1 /TAXON_ID=1118495 /ORGANISM="Dactyliosolen fragilissimus" /LENGTH=57 /DNA_ID=CAMNT_0027359227 /DNA_START=56 /DNA_END=229 /DNA_ORIENTATION=+
MVGMSGEDAKKKVLEADASLLVQILPQDSIYTCDYKTDRVRIFVDDKGNVARQPSRG